ncbi:MAG: type II toxin-antitoxin system VapC family toxin [Syntrophaceae bacterium]|nr:type II toxin-antitoxin system VapC family toxin [Syntrophaceae bacterium]
MSGKRVLDSYALLAYLKKEDRYEKVKNLLGSKGAVVLMNEINLGECFYILARERGMDQADYFLHTILPNLPLVKRANTFEEVVEAAKIKAGHALSYADCFAIQTALKENAPIVTGDPEFKKAESLVKIDWL